MTEGKAKRAEKYGFIWTMADKLFKTRLKQFVGICGKSGRIAKVASERDALTLLVVQDVYVSGDTCEEGKRCLDFQCSLNETTWASFAASINKKRIGKPPAYWGKTVFANEDSTAHDFSGLFGGDPGKGGILLGRKSGKGRLAEGS